MPDYTDMVNERIEQEAEFLPQPPEVDLTPEELEPAFVLECLANGERGDGTLYAELHRDQVVFVKKSQEWLAFKGHYWEQDIYDLHLRKVKAVAEMYLNEATGLKAPIQRLGDQLRGVEKEIKTADSMIKSAGSALEKAIKANDEAGITAATQDKARGEQVLSEFETQKAHLTVELAGLTGTRKKLISRVDKLNGVRGADSCVKWSHIIENPLAISGDELDQHPLLLPCANGVVDLETGELRPGKPSDWLSKGTPIEYHGFDTPAPEWETFLHSMFEEEVVDFQQELMGYCASGITLEQFIAVHVGKGRNGKGVLFEMIEQALGPLYWTVQAELLLDNKTSRSSSGASPDILALRGRRLAAASETDQGRRISAARVKELTGSDTLNARLLYDKADTNFRPTHKLHLRTNEVPGGLTKDFALRERLIYLKYKYMFVDDPDQKALEDPNNAEFYRLKDRGLKERLQKELPGILSWLVRGFAKWQKRGKLVIPESCVRDAEKLQQDEDLIGQFIAACCQAETPSHRENFKAIYDTFAWWFNETQDARASNCPSKKWFGKELDKRGFKRETAGGDAKVFGLGLIEHRQLPSGWSQE